MRNRVLAALLVVMLSLNLAPYSPLTVHAEEETSVGTEQNEDEQSEEGQKSENGEVTEFVRREGAETEEAGHVRGEGAKTEEAGRVQGEGADVESPKDRAFEAGAETDPEEAPFAADADLSLKLLYGDENLADEDALVMLFMGDGFTAGELDLFFKHAKEGTDYLMKTSPWDEFTHNVKVYAVGTVSNESGVKGDKAVNYSQALADTRDTYFGTYYWSGGTQRAVWMDEDGVRKLEELKELNHIETDCDIILVNSTTEGGTTDTRNQRCFFSIDPQVNDCFVHELGHAIANLADEYWPGWGYESANLTKESDPAKVKWARFVGLNGVGVYEHKGQGWYRPSQTCKMQILGNDHEFCEVCKETHRDMISSMSNVTNIAFQTYADKFYERKSGDMSEYFIIRKGSDKTTGKELGSAFHLTYSDSEGNILDEAPNKRGTYRVKAEFGGNAVYDACSLEAEYTIDFPDLITTLNISSKEYDGKPAEAEYEVDKEIDTDDYYIECTYTGSSPYSMHPEKVYESTEAPKLPGDYVVQVAAYNKKTKEMAAKKTKDFEIKFKAVPLVVNDDSEYAGANSATSNFVYYIYGEGYTAEEQDKFLKDAGEFVENFLSEAPYREMTSYLNFYAVQTVSGTSGIGKTQGDTFFELSYGGDGVIKMAEASSSLAQKISYDKLDPYYRTPIIMVNGADSAKGTAVSGGHGAIAVPATAEGAKYAAREATNIFVKNDIGHEASSEQELEEQKILFLEYLAYNEFTMILSDIYKAEIVENGKPVDIMQYIHTYNTSIEIPNDRLSYNLTYYADENGERAEEPLENVPSVPGTYHVYVTLEPTGSGMVEGDFSDLGINKTQLWPTKAWLTFKIDHAEAARVEAVSPTYDKGGNTAYWYCAFCGKYYADVNGVMDESTAYEDSSFFALKPLKEEDPDKKPSTGEGTSPADKDTSVKNNGTKRQGAVQTGDTSDPALWILLMAVSMAAGAAGYRKRMACR